MSTFLNFYKAKLKHCNCEILAGKHEIRHFTWISTVLVCVFVWR